VTPRRFATIVLLATSVLVVTALPTLAPAAVAQEEGTTEEAQLPADEQPALPIAETESAAEAEEAWTFRFLVPTLLVIALVAIVGTVLLYAVRVRGRYRVVR
jgi:hypothetical protein